VGRRHQRRIERTRQLHFGAAIVAGLAVLAGAITILASTLDDGEAAAGTPTASRPARVKQSPAQLLTHTLKKTVQTKRPPSPYPDAPEGSGEGRRIVYCISCQQVWLVEDDEYVYSSYAVSGRRGYPRTGTYKVIRKVHPGYSHTLRLPYFVGFTFGTTTDVGFHGIPLDNGRQIQSDSQLGTYRSSGCVRQNQTDAKRLWDFAPMGTKVVVIG
jgi:lipoprotein-anchoring transpeptidase ErfK/SrfK